MNDEGFAPADRASTTDPTESFRLSPLNPGRSSRPCGTAPPSPPPCGTGQIPAARPSRTYSNPSRAGPAPISGALQPISGPLQPISNALQPISNGIRTNLRCARTNLECTPTNLERDPHQTQVHSNQTRVHSNQSPTHFSLKAAVEEGFKARKWPSHQGKEALWDEF